MKMARLYKTLFVGLLLQIAYSMPHKKHSKHHHKISQDHPCVAAATALGEILTTGDQLTSPYISGNVTFNQLVQTLVGFDVFDQNARQEALCSFADITALSQFLTSLEDVGLDFQLVKAAYDYAVISERMVKYSIERDLNATYSWSDVASLRINLQLLKRLEASGILDLDADSVDLYIAASASGYMFPIMGSVSKEPLSTLPLETQCSRLTNSLRRAWNVFIRNMEQYNPDASQEARDAVRQWTGIELNGHTQITSMVCEIMEAADSDGLRGVYQWIQNQEILKHLLSSAYPYLLVEVDYAQANVNHMTEVPSTVKVTSGLPQNLLAFFRDRRARTLKSSERAGSLKKNNHKRNRQTRNLKNKKSHRLTTKRHNAQLQRKEEASRTSPMYYGNYGSSYGNYGGYGGYSNYANYGYYGSYGSYGYGGPGYGYYYEGPSEEIISLYTNLGIFLAKLREMNIFSLNDDLST